LHAGGSRRSINIEGRGGVILYKNITYRKMWRLKIAEKGSNPYIFQQMILLEGRYGSMTRMLELLKSVNKWKRLAGILQKTALRSSPALTFFGNIRFVLYIYIFSF
jgi:hypothetical protein